MKPQNKRKGRRVLAAAYHLSEKPVCEPSDISKYGSFAGSLHGIYYNIMMPLINNLSLF